MRHFVTDRTARGQASRPVAPRPWPLPDASAAPAPEVLRNVALAERLLSIASVSGCTSGGSRLAASLARGAGARGRAIAAALVAAAMLLPGCARADRRQQVVLWHSYTGSERAALEQVGDDFNARHELVRLQLVAIPYDSYADKITNAIPNGNGPDLLIFAHDRIGHWARAGLIEPIEYFVDEPFAARFEYRALAAMAWGPSLYGLPLATKSVALFYRADLVAAPPRTTADLVTLAERLTERRAGRFGLVYENTNLYAHAAWLHGFGGRVLAPDGRLDIATKSAAAALRFARRLGGPEGCVPPAVTATMVATLFNERRAAMAITGPWFVADIRPGVPWAVTTLPVVSETGRAAAPFYGAEGVLMSARARAKQGAFAAMAALASDASAMVRARRAGQIVPNQAALAQPDIGRSPLMQAFRDQLEAAVLMPAAPEMRLVWTPYRRGLQRVIEQGHEPVQVLAEVEREIESYLGGRRR